PLLVFKYPPPPALYPLSLHDALPIWPAGCKAPRAPVRGTSRSRPANSAAAARGRRSQWPRGGPPLPPLTLSRLGPPPRSPAAAADRKSTRLNSSHLVISYAVFCLKKK